MDPFVMLLVIVVLLIIGIPIGKCLIAIGVIGCIVTAFFLLTLDEGKLTALLIFGLPSIIALIIGLNNESLLLYEIFF